MSLLLAHMTSTPICAHIDIGIRYLSYRHIIAVNLWLVSVGQGLHYGNVRETKMCTIVNN